MTEACSDGRAHDTCHVGELAVGEDGVIERTHADCTGRDDEIGVVDGANHVHGAERVRFELLRVDIHHDLAVLSAEWRRDRSALHFRDLRADLIVADVAQLGVGHAFTLEGDQADREAGGVEAQHDGR